MKSTFAPSMRFLAGGLLLAAAAIVTGCAAAKSRHSRSADTLIEELGAPNGKGFDDIVVKLAPLAPAKPAKDARPAERPPAPEAVPETPAVSAAAPPPNDSAKPASALPVFLREPLPVIDSASAEEIAEAVEPNSVAAPASVEAPVEAIAEAPIETRPDAPAESSREAAAPSEPAQTAEPEKGEAPAVAEAEPASPEAGVAPAEAARPLVEEQPAPKEGESPLAFWQEIVAALALVGLLAMKLAMKYVRRAPAPSKAVASKPAPVKAAEGDPAGNGRKAPSGRFAAIRASIAATRAKLDAIRAKIAALRGGRRATDRPPEAPPAAAPKQAPKKSKTLDWTEVASALRQRFGGGKPAAAPGAHGQSRVVSLAEAKQKGEAPESWEASEEDGPELLEPGDSSARAIVMNARRRLRSTQS